MDALIRPAVAQDYAKFCALVEQVDALHRDHLPHTFCKPAGPARSQEFFSSLLTDETVGLFVAELNEALVGFVHILIRDAPPLPIFVPRNYAIVDTLVVKQDCRSLGIGKKLMDKAHEWARLKGATAVELNVYAFNSSAIAFYHSLGYDMLCHRMSKAL